MLASEIPFFSVGYIQSLIIIHYSVYPAFIINFIESSTQTEQFGSVSRTANLLHQTRNTFCEKKTTPLRRPWLTYRLEQPYG